jgi:hypothetical protein
MASALPTKKRPVSGTDSYEELRQSSAIRASIFVNGHLLTSLGGFNFKIFVDRKSCELNGPDAGDHILESPLIPEDSEELKARRTDIKAPCDRVGGLPARHEDIMDRIQKVRMVRGVAAKNCPKIEAVPPLITEKPPLV